MSTELNTTVAARLDEAANLMEDQEADHFRVRAYRLAADTVAALDRDLRDILEKEGVEGLIALPHIGQSIAGAIERMVRSGRWMQLERLRGEAAPDALFQTIPGVGAKLARRIHEHLGAETLEALEVAAHDGRLDDVPGVGARRAAMIRASLSQMLARRPGRMRPPPARRGSDREEPDVGMLLDIDREYRVRSGNDDLPKIAPRRFNPENRTWLPILHAERGQWNFTALYSNTARAHELARTRDWVVIYFHADSEEEGQRTVVTETGGALAGRRVVRGREAECRLYYTGHGEAA